MKHRKRAMQTQTVLTLSIALVTLIGILLVGILTSIFYVQSSKSSALDSTREIVTQVNNNLGTYISDIMNVADYCRNIARSTANLSIEDIESRLEILKASRNDLTRISIFDTDGNVIATTFPDISVDSEYIKNSSWFRKAIEGEENAFFTGPHLVRLSKAEANWVITYSSIINLRGNLPNERKQGILLINLNFNAVSEIVKNANLPSNGYVYLITNDGKLVYHPKDQEIKNRTFIEDFEGVDNQVFGSYISKFQDKERITVIESVAQTGWRIIGIAYTDELIATQKAFSLSLMITIIAIIILTIFLSQFIARYIASPIKQLESIMRQVQKGNFDVIAPIEGTREVQSLSSSFAIMIVKIRKLMVDIKRVEELKRQHELDALQAKINPHFLYNTLDSMIWMAETGDNQGVVKMATALASLFRISIAKGHDTITLSEELYHTKSYLEIQQIRYKDKFTFSINLPQALENCPTIKLICQPIVENSIYHGIKMLQEEGRIDITVKESGDDIVIKIQDNGIGMSQEVANSLLDTNLKHENTGSGSGIGLQNVDQRIKLSYGDKYGLKIESELEEGTVVTITIPHLPDIKAVVIHNRTDN